MSGAAFLRLEKLTKGAGHILAAARHNRRALYSEKGVEGSIRPHLSNLNERIHGPDTPEEVAELAKQLMREAGVEKTRKIRKDAVRAIEVVFSLPLTHRLNDGAYFRHCLRWTARHFGGSILSADIHRDEANPHCHVLILPLIDGRMVGSDMMGNKKALNNHIDAFFDDVGASYGLTRPPAKMAGQTKDEAGQAVIKYLRATNDPALNSAIWPSLREQIESNPATHMLALGLTNQLTAKPMKTMAQIFTSKGKGSKTEKQKPIGFTQSRAKTKQTQPPKIEQTSEQEAPALADLSGDKVSDY